MVERSPSLKAIGERVRYWRKEVRGLTLQKIAEQIGSSHGALAKLETGEAGMSLERIERLAAALNLPVGFLADPSMRYVPVQGYLTGAGGWAEDPGPWFDNSSIYPLILPDALGIEDAIAFEKHDKDGMVICTHFNGEPVDGDLYVVQRLTTAAALGLVVTDETDTHVQGKEADKLLSTQFSEFAQRVFVLESAALSEAPTSATLPVRSSSPQRVLRRSVRLGEFKAKSGPPADLNVARHDPAIARIWRVVGGIRVNA